jgi:hypothetical protein
MECSDKERQRPAYKKAVEADHEAIRSGNYNFSGIGEDAQDMEQEIHSRSREAINEAEFNENQGEFSGAGASGDYESSDDDADDDDDTDDTDTGGSDD